MSSMPVDSVVPLALGRLVGHDLLEFLKVTWLCRLFS